MWCYGTSQNLFLLNRGTKRHLRINNEEFKVIIPAGLYGVDNEVVAYGSPKRP